MPRLTLWGDPIFFDEHGREMYFDRHLGARPLYPTPAEFAERERRAADDRRCAENNLAALAAIDSGQPKVSDDSSDWA